MAMTLITVTYSFSQKFNHISTKVSSNRFRSPNNFQFYGFRSEPSGAGQYKRKIDSNKTTKQTTESQNTSPWTTVVKGLKSQSITKQSVQKIQKPVEPNKIIVDELQCKHFESCGGCTIKGNFTQTPTIKRAEAFFASYNIKSFPVHVYNHWGWRTHVKLAVQPLSKWGGLKFGLYKTGTHEVEAIPDCRVHHPRINEAVEFIRAEATSLGIKGYQYGTTRAPPSGELRYIQLSLERRSGKVQLVLVWNSLDFKASGDSLPRLTKSLKSRFDLFHSITVNFQTSKTNEIFNLSPESWKLLWGPHVLQEIIGEATFLFRPQIFRQSNLDAFEKGIIPAVIKRIPVGSVVAELYSGIGVIGINAASRSKTVLCSDANEYVDDVFDECVESLPAEHVSKVYYENVPAAEAIEGGQCDIADVLIVDPPRKGLDEAVMSLLLGTHPTKQASSLSRLIYISCGYEALERDIKNLLASGLWKLSYAEGFALLPGSDHIELVIVLDKKLEKKNKR